MKFICLTEHLLRAVLLAERFVGKNLTLPVLGAVLLEASGRGLRVTATNLEHAVQIAVPGDSVQDGRVAIPVKPLSSFLQSVSEEKVSGEGKQGSLFVKTPFRETRIHGTNAEDFPLLPRIKKKNSFSLAASLLQNGIESVIPAVSVSEFKPALTGVFFKTAGNALTLAATDVFRLAEKNIPLPEGRAHGDCSFILPHRVAHEVRRAFGGDPDADVCISLGDNQVLLEGESVTILSRTIDGLFPDYQGIFPREFHTSSFLKRNDILGAVRGSSVFASKLNEVTLSFSKEKLGIASSNSEIGEYRMETAASSSGKDVAMSFNYRYLLDGVAVLHEEDIFFGVTKDKALLRNKSDNSFLYMLAPIHLS